MYKQCTFIRLKSKFWNLLYTYKYIHQYLTVFFNWNQLSYTWLIFTLFFLISEFTVVLWPIQNEQNSGLMHDWPGFQYPAQPECSVHYWLTMVQDHPPEERPHLELCLGMGTCTQKHFHDQKILLSIIR